MINNRVSIWLPFLQFVVIVEVFGVCLRFAIVDILKNFVSLEIDNHHGRQASHCKPDANHLTILMSE